MKAKISVLLLLLSHAISAQLTITGGTQFSVAGNTQLTLQNTDLINDGNFAAGNSSIRFSGNSAASISGNQPVQFFTLEMNKTNNTPLILQRSINVSSGVIFSSGLLNLNGFNIDLGSTGSLFNEQENSRVIGPTGGQVLLSTVLNGTGTANPGNLGLFIDFSQSIGHVIIKRGHQSQSGTGLASSILRYYDIAPANNVILDELQINYFDGELNGSVENGLTLFKSNNLTNWLNQGFDSRNVNGNFVTKNNTASFSRWTLSADSGPLAIHFILFNAKCDGNTVVLTWKTAQEQNSSRFDIEKSNDDLHWSVIGNLTGSGNSSTEKTYSFTDNNPASNSYYRIAGYDLDGRVQYTNVLQSSCSKKELFTLWPNPTHDAVFINISVAAETPATLKLFDNKGALIKIQRMGLLTGINQLRMDLGSLANGVYSLSAEWNNGQTRKVLQLVRR